MRGLEGEPLRFVSVHSPECRDAQRAVAAARGRRVDTRYADDYDLPHSCLPAGYAGPSVIRVIEVMPQHTYRPGKMQPVNLRHPLCADCRNPKGKHRS